MENPTEIHLLATKRILRYLQGTRDFGLFYKKGEKSDLFGFTDSDYARDQDDRRSTSEFVAAINSASVVDKETICCFLEDHDTAPVPNIKT